MSGAVTARHVAIGPPPGPAPSDLDLLNDHVALLANAQAALDRRRATYPGLVEKQAMSPADAASDIAAWELIAAEWHWIRTGEGSAPASWTRHDRIDAVDLALQRTAAALANTPNDAALLHQQDLYRAIRWHLTVQFLGVQRSHWLAELNHALRARANAEAAHRRHGAAPPGQGEQREHQSGAPTKTHPLIASPICAACDRRAEDTATQACTRTDCGLGQRKEAA